MSSLSSHADWPARLRDPAPAVRRVAILDAAKSGTPRSEGLTANAWAGVLLEHLPRERDPKARLLIIRALGVSAFGKAMTVLASLRADPATPPQESHAALLAHDAIEVALRPPPLAVQEEIDPASEE